MRPSTSYPQFVVSPNYVFFFNPSYFDGYTLLFNDAFFGFVRQQACSCSKFSEVMTLPYKFNVVQIPTLNKWKEDYYIPTVFRQDPVYDPIPGRIAHHNQMVTGSVEDHPTGFHSPGG
jgi:hypothetical protein